jgi:parvulin-like peptidyl-prolyl isomerase
MGAPQSQLQGQEKSAPAGAPGKAEPSAAAPQAPAASLPPGVVARVNGKDITFQDYLGYLYASFGKSKLEELVDRLLLEEEAKSLGVALEPQKVEALVDERLDRTLKSLYQGNRDKLLESLARRGMTEEENKAKVRQEVYYETLTAELILRGRQVSEADLQKQFEKSYGEGGVQLSLRHILVAVQGPAAGTPPAGAESAGRSMATARERAEKILKELQGGLDFVQAVKQYSDDAFTKRNDGKIPVYRKGFFGEAFHDAVSRLTEASALSGVVESPRGAHIVQLIGKQVTRFEEVRAELEKVVKAQGPSAKERHELLRRLREKARIQGL